MRGDVGKLLEFEVRTGQFLALLPSSSAVALRSAISFSRSAFASWSSIVRSLTRSSTSRYARSRASSARFLSVMSRAAAKTPVIFPASSWYDRRVVPGPVLSAYLYADFESRNRSLNRHGIPVVTRFCPAWFGEIFRKVRTHQCIPGVKPGHPDRRGVHVGDRAVGVDGDERVQAGLDQAPVVCTGAPADSSAFFRSVISGRARTPATVPCPSRKTVAL